MKKLKRIEAAFFQLGSGKEPVRDWLLSLTPDDRKVIGDDIRTAEFGWPIGMPLCRAITGRHGLWEVRSSLSSRRIARVFFCIKDNRMVLLHGIIKKTQQTPVQDLDLAERRRKELT
ncbi:MAG: type II toxin-antitoxin system RelE/ParE family toxin [Planctomycetaceae bacterium]